MQINVMSVLGSVLLVISGCCLFSTGSSVAPVIYFVLGALMMTFKKPA